MQRDRRDIRSPKEVAGTLRSLMECNPGKRPSTVADMIAAYRIRPYIAWWDDGPDEEDARGS